MTGDSFRRPLLRQERRIRDRDEMTTAILTASRVVMLRGGVAALNLNEVARMVGIQTPGLYKYFGGKAGIYDALFRVAIDEFRLRLERVWAETPPGWSRLKAWMEERMRFAQEAPELDHLLLGRDVPGFIPSPQSMEESHRLLAASTLAFNESLRALRLSPDLDVDRSRGLFFALMHGLTTLHTANEPNVPVGTGFYGGLIPDAIEALRAAFAQDRTAPSARGDDESGGLP